VLLPPAPTPAPAATLAPAQPAPAKPASAKPAPAMPAPAHAPAQSAPAKKGLLSSLKQGALQAALAEAVTATEERFEHLEGAGNSGIHADVFLSYAIY
jgi:hypothetical protein